MRRSRFFLRRKGGKKVAKNKLSRSTKRKKYFMTFLLLLPVPPPFLFILFIFLLCVIRGCHWPKLIGFLSAHRHDLQETCIIFFRLLNLFFYFYFALTFLSFFLSFFLVCLTTEKKFLYQRVNPTGFSTLSLSSMYLRSALHRASQDSYSYIYLRYVIHAHLVLPVFLIFLSFSFCIAKTRERKA